MNIIINTSNLYVGGGVQVALSFINELNNISAENNYHVFVSRAVRDQIDYRIFSDKFKYLAKFSILSLMASLFFNKT